MRKLIAVFLSLSMVFWTVPVFATHHHKVVVKKNVQRVQVIQKNVQFDLVPFKVIGIPVNVLGLDYYYSAGTQQVQNQVNKLSSDEIEELKAEIRKLKEACLNAHGNDNSGSVEDGGTTTDNSNNGNIDNQNDLDKKVYAIFNTSCSTCHNSTKANKDLIFDLNGARTKSGNKLTPHQLWKIYSTTNDGSMPQGKTALNDDQVRSIYDWVNSQFEKQ